jgi:hypothetical protein
MLAYIERGSFISGDELTTAGLDDDGNLEILTAENADDDGDRPTIIERAVVPKKDLANFAAFVARLILAGGR